MSGNENFTVNEFGIKKELRTIEEILEVQKRRSDLFPRRKFSPVLEMLLRDSGLKNYNTDI